MKCEVGNSFLLDVVGVHVAVFGDFLSVKLDISEVAAILIVVGRRILRLTVDIVRSCFHRNQHQQKKILIHIHVVELYVGDYENVELV